MVGAATEVLVMMKKHIRKSLLLKIAAVAVFFASAVPAFAWYFFTGPLGDRMQWVFSTSCNPKARPITIRFDSDTTNIPAVAGAITAVLNDWNNPQGKAINLLNNPVGSEVSMPVSVYASYLSNPTAGEIWVAYDTDGSILRYLGISSNSILGVGLPLGMSGGKSQDICSGLVVINGQSVTTATQYRQTLLHELGHVLGFAHNIAGGNGETVRFASISNNTLTLNFPGNLPVMYPFAVTGATNTLTPDDQAGAYAVYGP